MSKRLVTRLPCNGRASLTARLAGAAVLTGCLAYFGQSLAEMIPVREQVVWPYVWTDVAVVHWLCAAPWAVLFSSWITARLPALPRIGMAALLLAASAVFGIDNFHPLVAKASIEVPFWGGAMRAGAAACLAVSAALACSVLWRQGQAGRPQLGLNSTVAMGSLAAALLVLVPATYVGARCRHDLGKLTELLEQGRISESRMQAWRLLALDGRLVWRQRPLFEAAFDLEQAVAALRSQVAIPLYPQAAADQRLARARQLAMLNQTDAALAMLASIGDPSALAEVEFLGGAIYQSRADWQAALACFERAQTACRARGELHSDGLAAVTRGIAYCQRKTGRYAEAEATYQQLLTLTPTADIHFLLAQFYEDAQQAADARRHAVQAMELAPDRYRQPARELIRKLSVYQFGCLGVFQSEGHRQIAEGVTMDQRIQ